MYIINPFFPRAPTASGCNPKHIGGEAQVCVCSAEHHCEGELEHLNNVSNETGVVTSFETNKAGSRFDRHTHRFVAQNPTNHVNLEVTIDRTQKHQKIIGFVSAFTDSAG